MSFWDDIIGNDDIEVDNAEVDNAELNESSAQANNKSVRLSNLIKPYNQKQTNNVMSDTKKSDFDQILEKDQPQSFKKVKKEINYEPKGKNIIYITRSGAFIKFEFLCNDLRKIKKIENYFTLRKKLLIGPVKQLKCCKVDKTKRRIIIPRFGVFELLNSIFDLNNYTTKSQINDGEDVKTLKWNGNLTDNQKIIAKHIMEKYYTKDRIRYGSAGCILNLEAGQGKSYLAAYLISQIKKKTAIILHSTSLLLQWDKVLRNTFGDTINIGYYYGKKKTDGDIILMIIDSAASEMFAVNNVDLTALDYYKQFGFIVYDECHIYSYKAAQKVLKIAQAPYVLGLSATPDENLYGFDKAVWWELGPVLNAKELSGYQSISENFTAEVHRIMYYGPSEYTRCIVNDVTETVMIAPTINMICKDEARNAVVVECIKKGLDKGLFMFVFSDRRIYLLKLKRLLKELYSINGEVLDNEDDFIRIVGGAKDEEMEKAEVRSRVIFTTYQYMGTGKSIIKMNGLVLATPRKSKMKQYINRIFRLGSDASIKRHIWDICDMKTKLSNQWSTRHKYYDSKGYEIASEKIKYEDYIDKIITIDDSKIVEEISGEDIDENIDIVEEECSDDDVPLIRRPIEYSTPVDNYTKKYRDGTKELDDLKNLKNKSPKNKPNIYNMHNRIDVVKRTNISNLILSKLKEE